MDKVVYVSPYAAKHPEHELQKDRPFDQAAVNEVLEAVKVADVITLELETRAVRRAEAAEYLLDVAKGVAKNRVA